MTSTSVHCAQEVEKSHLEELEQIVFHIELGHASEENLPVGVVDVFHDEAVVCV